MNDSSTSSAPRAWEPYVMPSLLPLLYHPSYHASSANALEEVSENDTTGVFLGGRSSWSDTSPMHHSPTRHIPLLSSLCSEGMNPLRLQADSHLFCGTSELAQRIKDSLW